MLLPAEADPLLFVLPHAAMEATIPAARTSANNFFFIFFSLSSDKSFLKHATMLPIYHAKVKKKMKKFLYSKDIRDIDHTEYRGIFVITE